MKSRIFEHYFTTLLGLGLVGGTLVLVYKKMATLTEAGIFLTIAGGLIISKDPFSKKDNTTNPPTDQNNTPNDTNGNK